MKSRTPIPAKTQLTDLCVSQESVSEYCMVWESLSMVLGVDPGRVRAFDQLGEQLFTWEHTNHLENLLAVWYDTHFGCFKDNSQFDTFISLVGFICEANKAHSFVSYVDSVHLLKG